ncbi:hypothetical protein Tco_0488223 [Tanacetum coccineum]
MAFDLRPTEDVLSWPGNANMAFDLRPTEDVLSWPGNANMAFDLRPTEDVLPWPGNANMAFDLRPTKDVYRRAGNAPGYSYSAATQFGGVTDWYQSQGYREPDSVMSSASSAVIYTSVYTDSEPGRVFWGADEELSDGGSPRVIVYGYDGLPMQPVAPPSPDYVPVPPKMSTQWRITSTANSSPTLSPGYVADSNPEEDSEEDHADYPADGNEEEEKHLAPADFSDVPITDHVPSAEDTEALETDEAAPTHVPSPRRHTTRMSVRPQTPVLLPSEAEVERLLALPIPPPSSLLQIPSPPLPPPSSSLHLPPPVPTSLPLSLSPLPPLPTSLFIPPVDRREDTPEAELPPRKRLCLTALARSMRPREAVEEVAPTTLEGVNDRVTELAAVQEQDTQDIYAVIKDTQGRQTQIYQSFDIVAEDRQTICHQKEPLLLQGLLSATAAAIVAAAAQMTATAVEQLIEARVSAALANHETL